MRKLLFILVLPLALAPAAHAQNHGEIGVFGELFRDNATDTNFGGVGGRLSVNPFTYMQLEAEVGYDFEQFFTEGFTDPSTGAVSLQQSPVRVLHGLFGPKLQSGGGPVRIFVTAKGGAINFRFDPRPVTFATFTSSFDALRTDNVAGVFYPGGGVEAYLGPIGFRLDVGDEIYFRDGAHNNLRVTFGPHIRF